MAFKHNSTIAESEPDWGKVDKTRLPLLAHANHKSADPQVKTSWSHPHHFVEDGGDLDDRGVYTTGTLLLHAGGLNAAWAMARGGRSGQKAEPEIIDHLDGHRRVLGVGEHAKSNAEISADVPEWVMVLRTGEWRGHPKGIELITPAHLRAAAGEYTRHHGGAQSDLVIDYEHSSTIAPFGGVTAPAAGWIQEVDLRANDTELWGRVQWTTETAGAIARREYRYLSPVIKFGAPDRVTGEPVLLTIHSVALTNTPFMTSLAALNTDTPGEGHPNTEGGESMDGILTALAAALTLAPEEVASRLGLQAGAEESAVAEALMANAARATDLEAKLEAAGAPPPVHAEVATLLGVDPGSDLSAVKARVMTLQARAGLHGVRARLGLGAEATEDAILEAIGSLEDTRAEADAEALVANAVEAGKVPPSQQATWLGWAKEDIESTRTAINALPDVTQMVASRDAAPTAIALTDVERDVARQFGLSDELMAKARKG